MACTRTADLGCGIKVVQYITGRTNIHVMMEACNRIKKEGD